MPKETEVTFEQMKGRKLKIKKVDVSQWFNPGAKMWVREISAKQAQDFAKERKDKDDSEDVDWGIFAECVCHKNGSRFFPKGQTVDRTDIAAGLFRVLVEEAAGLNKLGDGDAEKN